MPKPISDEMLARIEDQVEQRGASRLLAQGTLDRGDFLAGAETVLVALGLNLGELPAHWTLGLIAGGDPLADAFERLAGCKPAKDSDWRARHEDLQGGVGRLNTRIYRLTEALTGALDYLDTFYADDEGDEGQDVDRWHKVLEEEGTAL